ncbi:MAG: MoaD/ThiS family protein, partial [SAR324 cluster bacterium]|nr:MoaD/ThiS family protein [SAR324 cluster bacterium]
LELMGPLVDFLPDSEKGKATLTLNNDSTIADLLDKLQIKRKVVVAVNGDEEKGLDHVLSEDDDGLVFTVVSGG